jgi:hypothetical protein
MKARLVLSGIFFLLILHGFSQINDSVPASGQIDKKDLLMSECDFDKNAEAMVLFDVGKIIFKAYVAVNTEFTRHIRIKILSNKGLDRANIKLYYLRGEFGDRLTIEDAQTFNLDEKGNIVSTRVDKKSFNDIEVNKRIGEKSFAFPEVRVGSVIEYSYKITGFSSSDWYFQESIPVKFSRYTVQYPHDMFLECKPFGSIPLVKQNGSVWSDTVHSFTMTYVPALHLEPYMTSLDDYRQKLSITDNASGHLGRMYGFTKSWAFVSLKIMSDEDFGKQLLKDLPNTEAMENGLKAISDPYRRMMFVYYYVKNNMHWNDRNGIETQQGIKEAWKEKKGTNGEINLILISLLKKAGLEPMPLLVRTHARGKIDYSNPSLVQFNRLMVYVSINDIEYVLDAADKYSSPKLIPWNVQYSNQLVIYSNGITDNRHLNIQSELKPFWDKKAAFKDLVQIQGNIDDEGLLTGDATVTSYEYSREKKMADLQQGKDQFLDKYFISGNSAMHIDSSLFTNENVDTLPLKQNVWFNEKLTSSGNYKYFTTNLFTGFDKNPFPADRRFSDVFFGALQNYNIVENIFIPDGYGFDGVPKDVSTALPDGSIVFTRDVKSQDDMISVHIALEFKTPSYPVYEYNEFREFYEKIYNMLNEQIVIKKLK